MTNKDDIPNELQGNTVDYVTAGAKAFLSLVPFAGSLLAEIAGSIIPKQRIDRIADFAARLEKRLAHLERSDFQIAIADYEFTDLVEESLRQAARATTPERREYLANLLAQSLSSETITYSETKHLMRLLGELNDVEIIWLRSYSNPEIGGDQEFRQLHKNVLEPKRVHLGSPPQDLEADALQKSYTEHLVRLGLVNEEVQKKKGGEPEFDRFSGKFKVAYRRTSSLGQILLRQIGLTD